MTITKFDKLAAKTLAAQIEAALQGIADEHGISIKRGNARFDESTMKLSVEIATINGVGVIATREANEFPTFCKMFNLDAADLGRKFNSRGRSYTITGIKPGNTKFPIMADRDDGSSFKFPQAIVIRSLHPDRDPKGSFGEKRDGTMPPYVPHK